MVWQGRERGVPNALTLPRGVDQKAPQSMCAVGQTRVAVLKFRVNSEEAHRGPVRNNNVEMGQISRRIGPVVKR